MKIYSIKLITLITVFALIVTLTACSGSDAVNTELTPVGVVDIAERYDSYEQYQGDTYTNEPSGIVHDIRLTEATVLRVIDGDTIVLSTGERVRFIGVDAPEAGEAGADEATQFVRERVLNQSIWLEADGNDTDRFDRLRRYIWLEPVADTTDRSLIQRYQLNALLLSNGLAEVMIIGDVRNEALFRSIAIPLGREHD